MGIIRGMGLGCVCFLWIRIFKRFFWDYGYEYFKNIFLLKKVVEYAGVHILEYIMLSCVDG